MEFIHVDPPQITDVRALLIAGLCERYTMGQVAGIPTQWERFDRYIREIPGVIDGPAYGVCFNFEGSQFDYLSGIEVTSAEGLPRELQHIDVAAQRCAVFSVQENIANFQRVVHTIWNQWLPDSGYVAAHAPMLECYRENFDPHAGDGGFEIWIPIAP